MNVTRCQWLCPIILLTSLCSLLSAQTTQPAAAEAPQAPEATPYGMQAIEAIGLGPTFEDWRLNFGGWVEQSFTFNLDSPTDRTNGLRLFDDRSNDYRFNQFVLYLERTLSEGNAFDVGGKVELLYGSDARFTHQRGLLDNMDDNTVQFDPLQFYGLVRLPVGNGITAKFGRYFTTHGAEVIDAPGNALFSHSYLFNFAIPFTHTGVQFDYPINDQLGVYYGLVQGWDVWDDQNETLSHMVGGNWKSADEKWNTFLNVITGPEREEENTDYRTVVDLTVTYHWSDPFSTTVNADYGNESGLDGSADNYWTGVAGYATYVFNPQLASTVRAEYFRDATASRLGFTGDVTEITAGLDIHPLRDFMNLRLRPEVRWDHAYGDDPFDGGSDADQFTLALDVIVTF